MKSSTVQKVTCILMVWCTAKHPWIPTYLPFGLCSSPKLFNSVADALEWVIVDQGGTLVEGVIHYLDNFLFGGCPNSDSCSRVLDLALQLCWATGFQVMQEKVVGPAIVIDFLGFIINSLHQADDPVVKIQYKAWPSLSNRQPTACQLSG